MISFTCYYMCFYNHTGIHVRVTVFPNLVTTLDRLGINKRKLNFCGLIYENYKYASSILYDISIHPSSVNNINICVEHISETLTQTIITEKQNVHDPNIKQKSSDYIKLKHFVNMAVINKDYRGHNVKRWSERQRKKKETQRIYLLNSLRRN